MPRGGSGIERGNIYHLISRFVAKEWFIESAVERRGYLSLLGPAIEQTDWRLFCYAVMSSHIHLGVVAGTTTLASWMRPMHTAFANWMNIRRERIGAVFVRGPNVIHVRPDGAADLIRYVHYNPVRAGVVHCPKESDWTSHRAYFGISRQHAWLDVECGLELGGFSSRQAFAASAELDGDADPLVVARLSPKISRGRPKQLAA
jgi:REP-associated tyrosine transposase